MNIAEELKRHLEEFRGDHGWCTSVISALEYAIKVIEKQEEGMSEALEQESKTGWIPDSERLPKENDYDGDVCKSYLIQDEFGDMYVAHYKKIGWVPMRQLKALGDKVVAWMPLPKPYKAESEE